MYKAYSSQLNWSSYFKLLKKLLFRLQFATTQAKSLSAYGQPELEKEKLITKAICSVLSGFHFDDVPDAIQSTLKNQNQNDTNVAPELEGFLKGIHFTNKDAIANGDQPGADEVGAGKDSEKVDEVEDPENEDESSDDEKPPQDEPQKDTKLSLKQIKDIQQKLQQKVLPVLERHLTEHKDKQSVRGFVSECYVKTIRKLPYPRFMTCLQRLINLLVT